ncbi:metal ABC transporter solute-binding protein, Zn/Mn family [Sporosarcina soli]|uniref:Metal ABC transporter solute-binding protein, Zn/Mn family n=1 Tax=Sporosarcina soli TaxID=334736 RepID=A0ABW0TQ56_9BACL
MKKKSLIILSMLTVILLAACGNKDNNTSAPKVDNEEKKLSVFTTAYPLLYFTERIGGSHVDVKSIYPAGADEHTFDPTQKDMIALADSDLFFYIGLGLEGFVENAKKSMQGEHVKMIATAESIPDEMLLEDEEEHSDNEEDANRDDHDVKLDEQEDHGAYDPHVWISPVLSVELASSIKNSLIEVAPKKKAEFEKNFESLRTDLMALDNKFKKLASNSTTKTFFVSHAAFGYIAKTYGLEQVAIAGLNTQSEPSQKQLASIVKSAKEQEVKYVFSEQNVSSKLTDIVRKEVGAESLTLHNLGVLTAEDIKNNEDYFSLMGRNIDTLKKALGGK